MIEGSENYNRARLASLIQEALEGRSSTASLTSSPEGRIAKQIAQAIQEATDER
jgi:hypothetical protein